MKGTITTIQRMSIHDGPGIRSTVFLKGCNMRCKWCHNPETWSGQKQLMQTAGRCIGCRTCFETCRNSAISIVDNNTSINREICTVCGDCTEACPSKVLSIVGKQIDCDSVVELLKKDILFYKESDGGVTISGGEPVMQPEFTLALLKACHEEGIHTAIETNLCYPQKLLKPLLPFVDLWLVDLKIADSGLHKEWTGQDNTAIIGNISYLYSVQVEMVIRTPVIPGVNDSIRELLDIENLITGLAPGTPHQLLEFHCLGFNKFSSLGMFNPMPDCRSFLPGHFEKLKQELNSKKQIIVQ